MTEEYKQLILKWLTHSLQEETGNNIPQFSQTNSIVNNLNDYIVDKLGSQPYYVKYIQMDGFDNYALLGNNGGDGTSFIVILDTNMNPIQYIDEYSSGVKLQYLLDINCDDENNFFALERLTEDGTERIRFVMLNNILTQNGNSQYELNISKAYNLPTLPKTLSSYESLGIYKVPSTSKYLFVLENIGIPTAVTLEVKVGTSNEWIVYAADSTVKGYQLTYNSVYYDWTDDNFNLIIPAVSYDTVNFECYQIINSGETLTLDNSKTVELPNLPTYDFLLITSSIMMINSTSYYLAYRISNEANTGGTDYIYLNNNGTFTELATFEYDNETFSGELNYDYFYKYNSEIFLRIKISKSGTDADDYYMCLLDGTNFYSSPIENVPELTWNSPFFVTKRYNLYNFYIQADNTVYNNQLIYNANSYNGQPYTSTNSLIPNSSQLFDSNNNLLFGRNLYNSSIYGNTTTATVQIPNNFLNNEQIANEQLLGQTNQVLVSANKAISKNVYEELFINFNNQINVIDNDNNLNLSMQAASNYVNQSVSNGSNYDGLFVGYAKINYQNSNQIVPIVFNNIDSDDLTATCSFTFMSDSTNQVQSIQILSNDQSNVYATIQGNKFQLGKVYIIKQEIQIN